MACFQVSCRERFFGVLFMGCLSGSFGFIALNIGEEGGHAERDRSKN